MRQGRHTEPNVLCCHSGYCVINAISDSGLIQDSSRPLQASESFKGIVKSTVYFWSLAFWKQNDALAISVKIFPPIIFASFSKHNIGFYSRLQCGVISRESYDFQYHRHGDHRLCHSSFIKSKKSIAVTGRLYILTGYLLLAVFGVLLGPVAQLLLKLGTRRVKDSSGWFATLLHPLSLAGYMVMLASAFIYFYSLRVVPLKDFVFILPFAYVFAPILSRLILKEIITGWHWISIALIVLGVFVFNIKM